MSLYRTASEKVIKKFNFFFYHPDAFLTLTPNFNYLSIMKSDKYFAILIFCNLLILTSLSLLFLVFCGYTEQCTRMLIQWSAKLAVTLFCLAFAASSLHLIFRQTWTGRLLENRPEIGLSFAVAHFLHLLSLIILQTSFHPVFEKAAATSLTGGGLAYVFILLMSITTFPSVKSQISMTQWKWLHLLGGWWIWLIFTRTYFKKVFDHSEEHVFFIMLIFVLILRIIKSVKLSFNPAKKV